jgi:hypothetical protein
MDELEQILCAGAVRLCTAKFTQQIQQENRCVQNTNTYACVIRVGFPHTGSKSNFGGFFGLKTFFAPSGANHAPAPASSM